MLISGNADGWIYALDVATGEPIWKFHLSKRGINVTPVVADGCVYISHSEENIDTPSQGRVVAINAAGKPTYQPETRIKSASIVPPSHPPSAA